MKWLQYLKRQQNKSAKIFSIFILTLGLILSISNVSANILSQITENSPENNSQNSTQDLSTNENFSWGVLAIDSNKSVYKPGETAQLEFAVLDEKGSMVCDADVNLTITDPSGNQTTISTNNGGIKINENVCRSFALSSIPDYEATHLLKNEGDYQLHLEATTKNGTFAIDDQIKVDKNEDFYIERQATSRVYPLNKYPVKILITPTSDFKGNVTETIPAGFEISNTKPTFFEGNYVSPEQKSDSLIWQVEWKAGETYELGYTFDSPNLSPALHKLGPLKIGNDFIENRSWQLAIDAVLSYVGGAEIIGTSNGGNGWVELTDQIGADSRDANMSVSYKIMGATPDSSIPVNSAITTAFGSASVVHIWRNVDQTTPIDATTTTATAGNSAVFNSAAITPVTSGAQVLSIGLSTAGASAGDTTITAPTGYGNQVDNNGNGTTASIQVGIANKAWSGSGAEDPAAWTDITTSGSESWVAATVALRPDGTLTYVGGAENSGTSPYSIDISGLSPQTGDIVIVATGWSHTTNGDPGISLYDLDLSGLSMQEGDVVIVATGWSHTTNGDPGVLTSGYTELTDQIGADTRDANMSVNYKVMGATPDSSVTCLDSGYNSGYGSLCLAHVWRGADPTTPIDATTTTATAANSALPNSPSITPVTAGAYVLSIGLSTAAASAGDTTITAPTGYTNQLDLNSNGTVHSIQAGIASKAWSGSGAEDPAAWTDITTSTSDSWVAATVALRPLIETTIDISGTANGNDGATVKYAINGTPGAETDTIGSGTWSITGITAPSADDVITVWVDNVADNLETTAVTKYSTGSVTGMVLDTNITTVGSNQDTGLTLTNLDTYDCTGDEDIMYQAGSSTLKVEGDSCAGSTTNSYSTPELEILSGDTLTVGGSETLNTYDLTIAGTLTSGGSSVYNVEHNWAKTGTFTSSTSTVNLTGADSTTQTISGTNSFNNLVASTSSNSAGRTVTFTAGTTTTVTGTWTVTGFSGKVITLASTAASAWTINPTAASVTYSSVSYSTNTGATFCATYTTNGGNNTGWTIVSDANCPSNVSTAHSFQRKTWHDGTRYWRSFQNTDDNRIEFEYSTDGTSWTENTSARISTDTNDFSIYADSTNAFIAYKTGSVANIDNLLLSNLAGYWKLDESSANGCTGGEDNCDTTAYANDGEWQGNATNTTGNFGNGVTFDGTGDYITVAESDSDGELDFGSGDTISLSAWINPTSLPGGSTFDTVIGKNSGGNNGFFFQYSFAGEVEFCRGNSGSILCYHTTATPVVAGSWQHVAATFTFGTDTSIKLYHNGTLYSGVWESGTGNVSPTLSNDPVSIGANGDGTEEVTGKIDDVRMYRSILTDSEMAQLGQPGYDIEAREVSSYPGTSFAWGGETVVYNGRSSTDYYQYPTLAYDSNNKIWISANKYATGTIDEQISANDDDGVDVAGDSTFHTNNNPAGTPWTECALSEINCNPIGGKDISSNSITTGLRFQTVNVPRAAVISAATIDLRNLYAGDYGTSVFNTVKGAKVNNLSIFSDSNLPRNVTATTATATWSSLSESIANGTWYSATSSNQPPSITSIVQEIVDQSGWSANNDMGIIVADSSSDADRWYEAYSYEGGAANAAKLHIEYTASQIVSSQSSSANDITSWGATSILDTSTNTNKYGVIVPRTSGAVYATWIDGAAIEGKNFNGTSWDGSPTSIATGLSGLSNTLSAVSDSSGNIHLTYIDSGGLMVYKKYTSSWQSAVTLDSNSANNYPTISLNSTSSDLYAFWERGDDIFYNKNTNISSTGDALDFDGTADYVSIPYNANYDYTTDLTVEFWFNPDNTVDSGISSNLGILSKANTNTDANNDWAFFWNSGNAGRLRFGSYGDYIQTTTSTWTAGTWYHVSATVTSSNTAYIYVNGVLDNYGGDTTIAADNINANQDTVLNIGLAKIASGDRFFDGKIDDFRIYNAARSEAQIQSDMNAELVGNETNLGGYWNFNDGTGQTVNDLSSNNNDGTLGATSGSSTDDPSWTSTIPFSNYWNPTATSWQTTGTNTYLTSNYSGANKIFVEWMDGTTIDWDQILLNVKPETPSLDLPTDAATSQILSTVLKTTTTDSESDYIRYKIELCEDSGMSVNCQTFDQTSSQTGWSGQDAQTSTAYASGTQATYTLQTPLALNDTYYWRSYAIDPAGANSWSTTQGTPYSFTTIAAPVVSTVSVNGGTAITLTEGTTTSINWTGTITDTDGNANISSAQGVLYRSGVAGAEACTPSNANCYVDASCSLSACAGNSCTATCNVSLEFFAEPTDSASLFPTEYWRGWIEATDANSQTGEEWSPTTTPDVQSLAAMDTSSSIAYDPLLPGDDTGATNETTTVTNTGNTVLDIEVSGDNFCTDYPTCAGYQIPVGYQEFDVTGFTYGLGNPLSGSPTTAQINLIKSTINPANSTANVYWGLGIPSPKEDGAYSGANTLTAVDGD